MALPIRNTVRVLLLNDKNEILLIRIKKTENPFWFTVGGGIDEGESLEEAAFREIYEETGITKDQVKLGPIVWKGELDYPADDNQLMRHKQKFIVAKTQKTKVYAAQPTEWEKKFAGEMSWFSLEKIKKSKETIFPKQLQKHLPDIISEKYPQKLIDIHLD